ncbi:aminotransferase-like domain-containing protein [Sinosporangium siamense]|uniref:GntR-family regulatory protein n=1 Tax=Sinosporangium siamense TaxID=1367973 RepID=A0A919RBV9_9ACTN|nr:PLP-dependent aminotransferase family protein [Sinosporangium siamense]GII90597.1 putative GntR-family regulatory protein [Sinosporangium siamense]
MRLDEVLGIWARGTGPLYDQLALAIQRRIESGDLPIGTRLPSERALAKSLSVSRTTVINAYARLDDLGWLERRQGAGTWVARRVASPAAPADRAVEEARSYAVMRVLRAALEPVPGVIDLATAAFKDAEGIAETLGTIPPEEIAGNGELGGYLPLGFPVLRDAVAAYLSGRGIPTLPGQVVITTGVQQSTVLLFSALAQDRNLVAIETPTWNGTLDMLRHLGTAALPLPPGCGDDFAETAARVARTRRPGLVWLTTGFHNPTGLRFTSAHAKAMAELAMEIDVPIVENATLLEYRLGAQPGYTVAQYAPDAPVITVGSLSKTLSPPLRLGWIRAPRTVVARIARLKSLLDSGASLLPQIVAARLLARCQELVGERRQRLQANCRIMDSGLSEALPEWTWRRPDGGLALWAELPRGTGLNFAHVAARYGVEVVPGSVFDLTERPSPAVRISLARSSGETVEAVGRLAEAWKHYRP